MRGAPVVALFCCWGAFFGSLPSGSSPFAVTAASAAELQTQGPAGCPDSTELGFRVERNLGVPLAQAPAVKFVVEMVRAAGIYRAQLRATSEGGAEGKQRTLTGASCSELADAVVVAMTLALGAASAASSEAPSSELLDEAPAHETSPVATTRRSAAAPSDVTAGEAPLEPEQAAHRLQPSLSLGALLDAGSLPDPGLGAVFGVTLGWQRLQLRALATLLFEQHTELSGEPERAPGADLQLFTGSLLGCTTAVGGGGAGSDAGLSAPLCLGLELGRLSGVGTGVVSPRSGSALWAAPRADASAVWCLDGSPLCLNATLTAAAPLTRNRFALTEIGTVYRPSAVVGRLSIGIGVGFD